MTRLRTGRRAYSTGRRAGSQRPATISGAGFRRLRPVRRPPRSRSWPSTSLGLLDASTAATARSSSTSSGTATGRWCPGARTSSSQLAGELHVPHAGVRGNCARDRPISTAATSSRVLAGCTAPHTCQCEPHRAVPRPCRSPVIARHRPGRHRRLAEAADAPGPPPSLDLVYVATVKDHSLAALPCATRRAWMAVWRSPMLQHPQPRERDHEVCNTHDAKE